MPGSAAKGVRDGQADDLRMRGRLSRSLLQWNRWRTDTDVPCEVGPRRARESSCLRACERMFALTAQKRAADPRT
jgi:hypothetical protein